MISVNIQTDEPTLEIVVDSKIVYSTSGVNSFLNLSYLLLKSKLEPRVIQPDLQSHPLLIELVRAVQMALHKSPEFSPDSKSGPKIPRPGTRKLGTSNNLHPMETEFIEALKRNCIDEEKRDEYLRNMMFPYVPNSTASSE